MVPDSVSPEETENWMQTLWNFIRSAKLKEIPSAEAPIVEIDLDKPCANVDLESRYGDCGSEDTEKPKANSFRTLPSFMGDFETKSDIHKVPTQYKSKPPVLDMENLHALMSTPVKVTLPLADVLKVKSELWKDVVGCLQKMDSCIPTHAEDLKHLTQTKQETMKSEPVPLNKVGEYCEGEDGNTTLLVEYNGHKSLAILDSGAGIAIATKQVWEAWGKLAIRKTRLKLQLADGFIEQPLGLLERVVVSSCNIEYEHTFAVVDFGKKPNYEIILGRPFMRQLKMIQDWGYNYLYLRHTNATTRIDMRYHSFRDVVINTPVRDYVSLLQVMTQHLLG